MRGNIGGYILLTVIILMLFGVVSLGDVLSMVFYIFMGIILLILISVLIFRHRLNRLRREAERQAAGSRHRRSAGGSPRREGRREGEVTVESTGIARGKVVRSDIGSYAEYEEIKEEKPE